MSGAANTRMYVVNSHAVLREVEGYPGDGKAQLPFGVLARPTGTDQAPNLQGYTDAGIAQR